jgi:hypothetical protein
MSFLQPLILAALPLIALPILIHLINQRRFQTIRWAAMMFILAANRMSRGYAKLRQWLILLFRTLAIAGLIFAVARPLASGWLGLTAGGKADTTIVIVDRSPSMRQQSPGTVNSKLETGRQQLARALNMFGSTRWVLIESTTNQPSEIESPDALLKLPATEPTSASADLPTMLQAARDYIEANKSGRTEIWICSDVRQNDWNAESGRWASLRDSFLEFNQGVRFHLLAYPELAANNVAVRVTDVRRLQTSDSAELLVSLRLTREGAVDDEKQNIPLSFEIEGARSEFTVEMTGSKFDLKDHRLPLERTHERGWAKVSIPADSNAADNDFYFVFDKPTPRTSIIVTDDPQAARPLQLAAQISPDPNLRSNAEVLSREQLSTIDWDSLSLLMWQGPLPDADSAKLVQEFVERGGQVIFFPPRVVNSDDFLGVKWQAWDEKPDGLPIETWRPDQDLLANTQSGAALPVGQLQVRKFCTIEGETTPIASLKGGTPLLARVTTNRGGVYFCGTTVSLADSSFATDGIVLYVLIQRALSSGAAVLGNTRQLVAGEVGDEQAVAWQKLAGANEALSTDYAFHGGVYQADAKLLALNRSVAEDQAPVLEDSRLTELFKGLDFARVDDQAGNLAALIQEIWRVFLAAMMLALILEAALCLPRINPNPTYSTMSAAAEFNAATDAEATDRPTSTAKA